MNLTHYGGGVRTVKCEGYAPVALFDRPAPTPRVTADPTVAEVLAALRRLDMAGPFARKLTFGDPEQVGVMAMIQSECVFCNRCLRAWSRTRGEMIAAVGTSCSCGGMWLPGAALEPHWRAKRGLGGDGGGL